MRPYLLHLLAEGGWASWRQGPVCSAPGWDPSLSGCSMQNSTCQEWGGNPPSGPWASSRELCQWPCVRGISLDTPRPWLVLLDPSPWQPQILHLHHPKQPPWLTIEKPRGGSGRKSTFPESSKEAIKFISLWKSAPRSEYALNHLTDPFFPPSLPNLSCYKNVQWVWNYYK